MDTTAATSTYRSHWGLRESPFPSGLAARLFYQSPTHEEALARLEFLVEGRQRLGLLLGQSGTGKSLVLERLASGLRRRGAQVANLSLLGADVHEFLWILAADLGLNPDRKETPFGLWRSLTDRVVENRYQQLDTVVLLDDADRAQPEVLDNVTRLMQLERGLPTPLVFVLAAEAEKVGHVGRRLLELAELRIDLDPWEEADTRGYLHSALSQAGRKAPVFSDGAVLRLHALSGGIPRRVNQLAALALVAGAALQLSKVDADTIESVYRELGVVETAA
jgi:general secretion pathway protein A